MSPEQPPRIDGQDIPRVPIDAHLFDAANELAETIPDSERQRLFYDCIARGREGALEYATWTFEHITDTGPSVLGSDSAEHIEKTPSHGLREALQNVSGALHLAGRGFELPKDDTTLDSTLGLAALQYAQETVHLFQDALEQDIAPAAAASALGIRDASILTKLSSVMAKLPEGVPERILLKNDDHS